MLQGDVGPDSRGEDEQIGGRRHRLGLGEDRLDVRLGEAQRACLRDEQEAELIQVQFPGTRNGGLEHLERPSGVALQGERDRQRLLGPGQLDQGASGRGGLHRLAEPHRAAAGEELLLPELEQGSQPRLRPASGTGLGGLRGPRRPPASRPSRCTLDATPASKRISTTEKLPASRVTGASSPGRHGPQTSELSAFTRSGWPSMAPVLGVANSNNGYRPDFECPPRSRAQRGPNSSTCPSLTHKTGLLAAPTSAYCGSGRMMCPGAKPSGICSNTGAIGRVNLSSGTRRDTAVEPGY